ncbi:MAG: rod shape-determining protein MreC [Candidatus Latescibacterota bacterium]
MHIFEPLFQKYRDKAAVGLLIILSLTLLILPQQAKLGLAKAALNSLLLPFEKFTHFVDDFHEVRRENRELKRQIASLLLERERLTQFRDERERMRKLAAFKEEQFLDLLPCEVIGRNLDRYQTVLVVDKGAADSLKVRMPVLSYQGYVGRVVEVFDNSAWIQLLCSRNNPVSCIDKRSRVIGILEWMHHSYFELKNVGIREDFAVGDTQVTSGFGVVVPKGFPVCVVTKVTKAIDGLSRKVEAKSDIKFRSLEEVFVVVDEIPWDKAAFYREQDSLRINNQ